jgi:hypothetical protein
MSETTQIHPDKVRAYLATDYRLGHTEKAIILNIGVRPERLATLFTSSGVACGAFLTAYNPRGAIQSDAANEHGHAELAAMLRDQGLQAVKGLAARKAPTGPLRRVWSRLVSSSMPPNRLAATLSRTPSFG